MRRACPRPLLPLLGSDGAAIPHRHGLGDGCLSGRKDTLEPDRGRGAPAIQERGQTIAVLDDHVVRSDPRPSSPTAPVCHTGTPVAGIARGGQRSHFETRLQHIPADDGDAIPEAHRYPPALWHPGRATFLSHQLHLDTLADSQGAGDPLCRTHHTRAPHVLVAGQLYGRRDLGERCRQGSGGDEGGQGREGDTTPAARRPRESKTRGEEHPSPHGRLPPRQVSETHPEGNRRENEEDRGTQHGLGNNTTGSNSLGFCLLGCRVAKIKRVLCSRPMWVVVLLLLPAPAGADTFGDRTALRALSARARGYDAEALLDFRAALSVEREGERWSEIRFIAAQAALTVGESHEALSYLEGLEAELPEVADFVLGARARAHRLEGDWDAALESWQSLLAHHAGSPLTGEASYGVADAYLARGDDNRALAAYEKAMRIAPRNANASVARFNGALLAERAHRWEDAASGYSAIVYYRPTDPMAEAAAARLNDLIIDGRAPEATFNARIARIDRLLGKRLIEQAEIEINELEFVAATRSHRTSIKYRRAQIAYRERDFDAAAELFGELVRVSHGWRKRSYELWVARCFSASDQNDRAISAYHDFADRYQDEPEGPEALFKAAWLAYNSREHARAVKMFGEFIDRYPTDSGITEALWYMAWNAYRLGDLPTALDTFTRLRRDYPRSALVQRAHYWQGRIYGQLGRVERARKSFRAAADAGPLDYYAMLAHQRLGELGEDGELAFIRARTLLATTGDVRELVAKPEGDRREPQPDELPEGGGLKPLSPFRLPWGGAVLDWDNPQGRRALRLIALGMRYHAADIVKKLPELPGHDADTMAYARARLLYTLGDFGSAYRIVAVNFRTEIASKPSNDTRDLHHLAYPAAYHRLVRAAGDEFGVSPLLLLAIMRQESAFRVRARSWASAHGLMQIIPPTAERIANALEVEPFSPSMLNIPDINVRFGGWYIAQLLAKYDGHVALALANYNAGPRAATKWVDAAGGGVTDAFVEEIPYRETRHYVKRVLGNLWAYAVLYGGGPLTLPENVPITYQDEPSF